MSKVKQAKDGISKAAGRTVRIAMRGEQFVQAVSLLIVAGFSYYSLSHIQTTKPVYWTVFVALVIIGLRGFVEFIKFLDKE